MMKLRVTRYSLQIIPETETDEAYLETVLHLEHEGDSVKLIRVNGHGLNCWAYAEAGKP